MIRITFAIGLALVACKDAAPPPPATTKPESAPLPSTATVAAADAGRGHELIGALKQRLVGALTEAMARGVPAAIAVCNVEAPKLAAELARDGVTVGRATRRPRNPRNLATGWQLDALDKFEGLAATRAPLAGASFARQLPDGRIAYAEPLVVQGLCLACHGKALAPDVEAALATRYPDDQATGYAEGDLRGIAWAELPAPR